MEVLPPSLTVSDLASSGSVLEPVSIGSVGHGGGLWYLLTEATSVAPRYQNLATQTQYTVLCLIKHLWCQQKLY